MNSDDSWAVQEIIEEEREMLDLELEHGARAQEENIARGPTVDNFDMVENVEISDQSQPEENDAQRPQNQTKKRKRSRKFKGVPFPYLNRQDQEGEDEERDESETYSYSRSISSTTTSTTTASTSGRKENQKLDAFSKLMSSASAKSKFGNRRKKKSNDIVSSESSSASVIETDDDLVAPDIDTEDEPNENEKKSNLFILNGTFFKILSQKNCTVLAKCMTCNNVIKGLDNSSSNYLRHLKLKHAIRYQEYKQSPREPKVKIDGDQSATQQSLITDYVHPKPRDVNFRNAKEFEDAVELFVISGFHPVSIVEEPKFQSLFTYPLPSRQTFMRNLNTRCDHLRQKIRDRIKNVRYLSTSADYWNYKTKNYFGVIIHYIDEATYKRISIPIAFRIAPGKHSFDVIARSFGVIYDLFEIDPNKIVSTTTDNASNFVKCFKEFGVTPRINRIYFETVTEELGVDEEFEILTLMENIEITSASEPIQASGDTFAEWNLPPHFRCAAHKLNLVASSDFQKIINGKFELKERHKSLISKCETLWKAVKKPQSSEIIREVLGTLISYPIVIRWNSLQKALRDIEKHVSKLTELIDKLKEFDEASGKRPKYEYFTNADTLYLKFLVEALQPVANAIDLLQAETLYGELLPVIHSLFQHIQNSTEKYKDRPLFKYVLEELQKCLMRDDRFGNFLKLNFADYETKVAILATLSYPKFKNRFVRQGCDLSQDMMNCLLTDAVIELAQQEVQGQNTSSEQSKCTDTEENNSFYILNEVDSASSLNYQLADHVKIEILTYFTDTRKNLDMLKSYKRIQAAFFKYNTPTTSSAEVERFFSRSTIIMRAKRFFNDKNFETVMLLNRATDDLRGY